MYNWACALASGKIFAATLQHCNGVTLRHFHCLQFLYTNILFSLSGCKITQNRGNGEEGER